MDHVHVLIQLKPSQGVAEVVQDTNVLNEAAPNTDTAAALSLAEQKSTLTQPTGNYTYSGEMAESSSRNTLGLGQEISKKLGI
jgi:hypothetical protein